MATVIYGLKCPDAGLIRYIGKSDQVHKRLYSHVYSANRLGRTHKQRWIAGLLTKRLRPELVILQELASGECWEVAERRWIAYAIESGWPLTNEAAGGEGSSPLGECARAKRFEAMGRPEVRQRMSLSAKARWADEEKRERGLAGLKSDARRKAQSESAKKRATPEYRAMMSARSKAAWADADKRSRILSGITPEVKKKVSEAAKLMWKTTDKSEVMLANLATRRKEG